MKKKLLFSLFIFTFILFIVISIYLYNMDNKTSNLSQADVIKKDTYNSLTSNKNLPKIINNYDYSVNCINTSGTVIITIPEYINNMQCKEYTLQPGDTLTSIAKRYISTCPLNSALKLIKEASNISNSNLLNAGTKIRIPETILNNGYIHTVVYGDTWEKLCRDYYPIYDSNYLKQILIFINDLPDNNLPLGKEIYLPNINI